MRMSFELGMRMNWGAAAGGSVAGAGDGATVKIAIIIAVLKIIGQLSRLAAKPDGRSCHGIAPMSR